MPLDVTRFEVTTDTGGDFVDTGPLVDGALVQIVCDSGFADTGTEFILTGTVTNTVFANYNGIGGAAWKAAPRIPSYDTGGVVSGDQYPFVKEPLRLTINQGNSDTGGKSGTVFVYVLS